jgi:CBS domain-containing protein
MKLSDAIACVRGDVYATKLVTASPEERLSSIASRMKEHNVGTVVVIKGQKPIGIITDRDLALALGTKRVAPEDAVLNVMTSPVRTIPDGAGIFAATQCMRDAGVRRLPIVNQEGCLVGIVSLDDLLRLLGRELYNLAEGVKSEMEVK